MVQNKLKLSLLPGGCLLRTALRNLMRLSQADARHSFSVDRWMSSEDCSAELSASAQDCLTHACLHCGKKEGS